MNYIEKAISIAIEGGYEPDGYDLDVLKDLKKHHAWLNEELIALFCMSPLFWQSLGKSLGWKQYVKHGGIEVESLARLVSKLTPVFATQKDLESLKTVLQMPRVEGWEHHWHRFIDHLASGKPANDFFKTLLE